MNRLLKQFTQMQKMMKRMKKKGGLGRMMQGMGGGGMPPGFPPRQVTSRRRVRVWQGIRRHRHLHTPPVSLQFAAFANPAENPAWSSFVSPAAAPRSGPTTTWSWRTAARSRDGRFIERLGFFNPIAVEGQERMRINTERIAHWQSHGAQTSPAVQQIAEEARRARARGGLISGLQAAGSER